ncbi:MAG: sugar ABC transporter substrate-binding protein [Planctomycetes bacterium]|nr:sugar ABC transporter substrate-binding protein [Planctomycetota bacterium]
MFRKSTMLVAVLAFALATGTAWAGQKRVAMIVKTENTPFFMDMKIGAQEAAKAMNVDLIFQAPEKETDIEKQSQMVENMVASNVDAIVLSASDTVAQIPAIVRANAKKIPVILVNDTIDEEALADQGGHYDTYIGTDNITGGRIGGEYAAKVFPNGGKVALIAGIPGSPGSIQRLEGFREGIASNPKLQVVAEQTANWERDQAFNVMQNILTSNPDIAVVFTASEYMGMGALEAIIQMNKADQAKVICFDAGEETKQSIRDGGLFAAVGQQPELIGKIAIESAIKAINGETLPKDVPVGVILTTKESLAK